MDQNPSESIRQMMKHFMHWQVSFSLREKNAIKETILAIGPYSRFEPENVAKAMARVSEVLKCELGGKVTIGREYKPVLYLVVPDNKADVVFRLIKKTMPEWPAIGELDRKPDETMPGRTTIRAWWD